VLLRQVVLVVVVLTCQLVVYLVQVTLLLLIPHKVMLVVLDINKVVVLGEVVEVVVQLPLDQMPQPQLLEMVVQEHQMQF
jgi:hypothetical protein